jgi:hypothetical protein
MWKLVTLSAVFVLMQPAAAANLEIKDYLGEWCSGNLITTITPTTMETQTRYVIPRGPPQASRIKKFDVTSKRAIVHWILRNPGDGSRITGQTVLELSDDKRQLTMRYPSDAGDKRPPKVLGRCD